MSSRPWVSDGVFPRVIAEFSGSDGVGFAPKSEEKSNLLIVCSVQAVGSESQTKKEGNTYQY